MILTLEIVNSDGLKPGVRPRMEFRDSGGTIGRAAKSDWHLPNPGVSGTHAKIHFSGGRFLIEDAMSTNGVFLNSNHERLAPGVSHPLHNEDRLLIEPYEIRVGIVDNASEIEPLAPAANIDDLFAPLERPHQLRSAIPAGQPFDEVFDDLPGVRGAPPGHVDIPTNWYEPASGSGHRPAPAQGPRSVPAPPLDRKSTPTPTLTPPVKPQSPPPVETPSRSVDVSQQTPRPNDTPTNVLDLAQVLRAAGLEATVAAPDVAADFGRILRIVIAGLMEVLQARQRLQAEFRIQSTTYQPRENNPLKFSIDVPDALFNMLVKRHPGYLGAVDAFEGAFADIRDHEVAMLAGMRAAFEAMLSKFDPEALKGEFDRQNKKGALVAVPGKLRYWELYCAKIRDMVRDPEASFRDLFGDDFANAYEEQLRRLKASRSDASGDLEH